MNKKLLRQLVDRHAPEPVKDLLKELDGLEAEKHRIKRREREVAEVLLNRHAPEQPAFLRNGHAPIACIQ